MHHTSADKLTRALVLAGGGLYGNRLGNSALRGHRGTNAARAAPAAAGFDVSWSGAVAARSTRCNERQLAETSAEIVPAPIYHAITDLS